MYPVSDIPWGIPGWNCILNFPNYPKNPTSKGTSAKLEINLNVHFSFSFKSFQVTCHMKKEGWGGLFGIIFPKLGMGLTLTSVRKYSVIREWPLTEEKEELSNRWKGRGPSRKNQPWVVRSLQLSPCGQEGRSGGGWRDGQGYPAKASVPHMSCGFILSKSLSKWILSVHDFWKLGIEKS